VIACPTPPPVQDSAVVTLAFRSRRAVPSCVDNSLICVFIRGSSLRFGLGRL